MGILNDICKDQEIIVEGISSGIGEKLCEHLVKEDKRGRAFAWHIQDKGEDINAILVDDTAPTWEKRALVAHELGHILLEHITGHTPLSSEQCETEARIFGVVFTALMIFGEYGGFHMAT